MDKIKILVIPSDKHGVGKYRMLDPYIYLGDNYNNEFTVDIIFDVANSDEEFKNYNIVVFHSFIHKEKHEDTLNRIKWLKSKGIKTVMDTDDYWLVDSKHPMYQQIIKNNIHKKKIELFKNVDYITTTTPIYADTINRVVNKNNVFVFPNAVNPNDQQFTPKPIKSDRTRFGWLGGSSHLQDIELLKDGIQLTLQNYKDRAQFVLCGFDLRGQVTEIDRNTGQRRKRPIRPEETTWYSYEKIFTNNYKAVDPDYQKFLLSFTQDNIDTKNKPYVRRWTESINSYANNYNYFDISLAPLTDTVFNNNKSQLKVIEAGFHKKAIIASDVKPYTLDLIHAINYGNFKNGNALLVSQRKNHKDWGKYMKKLIENPNLIEDLGEKLYETVKDKYSLVNVTTDRVNFIKSII